MYIVIRSDDPTGDQVDTIIGIFERIEQACGVCDHERSLCRSDDGFAPYCGDDTSIWRIRYMPLGVNVRQESDKTEWVREYRGLTD